MQRFISSYVGVDQGQVVMFSDYESNGPMWTGRGEREVRKKITFSEPFSATPAVQTHFMMWDISNGSISRIDLNAVDVTPKGFTIVVRTWGDTRIARVRISWQAIGMVDPEAWDI
ncbi:ATP synthase subunits region ORF 7 [Ketogulonicigenium robustum]|uniref:ATP synthase subunits region ORF 7 n=1 Tax=Ketogulonicigenium robustum TaxID=92947 RepID=A0A1W6NY12_9RHOB|nr:H-type lectin domain-containing protein [Ketogulonicigenium robustum]ARO14071.1 ATP synthase subunits region ORF 7 [Ketogulonicigenium robustum]